MNTVPKTLAFTALELNGLERMRVLNEEYVANRDCTEQVCAYLENAGLDDDLLLMYLRARKYRPEHAWQTLKRKAEVSFDLYPEIFSLKPAPFYEEFQQIGLWGVLKNRDGFGRPILCIRTSKWNPEVYDMTSVTNAFVHLLEKLLKLDDAIRYGILVLANCEGMGLAHAKQMGIKSLLRQINAVRGACPLRIKGVHIVNFPCTFMFLYKLVRPFFPKKVKQRFHLTTSNKSFSELHANLDPNILPDYLGGTLTDPEAFEMFKF